MGKDLQEAQSLYDPRNLILTQKYLTSDCLFGCYNQSDSTPEYYCENPNKVGYCCPKLSSDPECTQNLTASIYCSKFAKIINAKYLYCITFESACTIDTPYINATDENRTITTTTISDRGFMCWWELSLDRTVWNQNLTVFNVYITAASNVTVYVGWALGRENLTSFPGLTTIRNYTYNATQNVYVAAVPTKGKLFYNFSMTFNIQGSKIEEDMSFEKAFWSKAIGIIAGVGVSLVAGIGGWLYYQKYGTSHCKKKPRDPNAQKQVKVPQEQQEMRVPQDRKQFKKVSQEQESEMVEDEDEEEPQELEDYDEPQQTRQPRQAPEYEGQNNGLLHNAYYQNQLIIQNLKNQLYS
ncbi:UNKNOWN [Stylonychia lemnae]|uniref:Transmembrane protein n=1 Tax=Stylonychia lemnae TaxID=5949 RepID=A0A078ANL7_STYLE|nr:UNKNOWN [Stylonychia lemnae]|eukprot:CDW82892.1 UNKNOWN [Stylonychia lemnae]